MVDKLEPQGIPSSHLVWIPIKVVVVPLEHLEPYCL